MMNKQIIIATIVGLVIGLSIGSGVVYQTMQSKYFIIHNTNIGGFVFWNNKIFNLSEMKTIQD